MDSIFANAGRSRHATIRLAPAAASGRRVLARLVLAAAVACTGVDAGAQAAEPASHPPLSAAARAHVTGRIADLQRLHAPEAIERLEAVAIGGTQQWLSIRGANRANPVLLFIHGGPGSPMLPTAWAWQRPLEDYFTVVQWDQRGVGKNAVGADHAALAPTMTLERHVLDAEAVVEHLRRSLGVGKVFVMGYSWGSTVGTHLAARRPDLLHAYVGIGQAVPDSGSERVLYEETVARAQAAGDAQALAELRALAPYPPPRFSLAGALAVRKWARVYDGGWYGKDDLSLFFALPEWAPEYTPEDVAAQARATRWATQSLEDALRRAADSAPRRFEVPVVLLMGRHDLHTPYVVAQRWFGTIEAPTKRFVTFERSAHFPMLEEPGRFLVTMVREVLPLAEPR
ncbi:MAG: alpha/beta hydrolase [Steroidobacteraceae bacterium]|nr:alpha/beta hydrolase [Steroidobacteraceae bacterium]